jgi:hypothetical protein
LSGISGIQSFDESRTQTIPVGHTSAQLSTYSVILTNGTATTT